MARLPLTDEYNWGDVLNEYLLAAHNADGTLKPSAVAAATATEPTKAIPKTNWANGLPLFNVEEYGAVGDGVTDDYRAVLAAWNAMIASQDGGCVFFPRPVVYRVDAGAAGRVAANTSGAYALFRLPSVAARKKRVSYGVVGVGSPYSPRGNTKSAPATSSVLYVDYATPFDWSETKGLPAVFGAPDYDKARLTGDDTYSNVHFMADGITLRQPANPSLCGMNTESCASIWLGSVAFDVAAPLDHVPEPTHPTGAALLLPAGNANGAIKVTSLLVTGYYTGASHAGFVDIGSATIARCKVGVAFRRGAARFGHMATLNISQCPWGFAGYDPSIGVVPVPDTCIIKVDYCDIQDDDAHGTAAWTYTPTIGAHIYDPNDCLDGLLWAARTDVTGTGYTDALWVAGATHFSLFGLFGFAAAGSERIDASAHIPAN